ncbi:MAG TPA: hypothetical protein VGP46_14290 [Acidimicrobiales bacterium]|jgi:hypothetical protein|nr:hypothetical protein [Acidimicrobiales bacterium]
MTPPDSRLVTESPWWPEVRRAFGIPEHVSTTAAREAIARSLIKAVPPAPPMPPMPFHSALSVATSHVGAMLDALREGALDLEICGHGEVTDTPGGYHEDSAANTAVGIMEAKLRMLQKYRPWLEWLWATFEGYVSQHPYGQGDR